MVTARGRSLAAVLGPVVLVPVVLAGLAACTSSPAAGPPTTALEPETTASDTTTTLPPTTTTTVPLPEPVPIAWSDCGGGLDCATVTVPIDYLAPEVGTVDLALVRAPATEPERRIGTVLVNPGGPGASGVRRVARGFRVSPEVGRRFDVVGFDPRGVGQSDPISCEEPVAAFRATDHEPDDPAEVAALRDAARAVADACAASEGPRLRHLGTVDVARDVEVIRRAIGEPTISFVGLSYGTEIGLRWADLYPTSVRALVLDSVVNPAGRQTVSSRAEAELVDAAVDRIGAACDDDPTCPLAATGGFDASYDELARRIEAGEGRAVGVGPTQLAYAAFDATYDRDKWPLLWRAIADGLAGDLTGIEARSTAFTTLVPYSTFALLTCMDSPHVVGYEAWQDEATEHRDRSPRFAVTLANELLPCAFWPQSRYEPHAVSATGAPTILAIASTGDAATDYADARRVVDQLDDGVLLTVAMDEHIAIGDSECATEAATRYLVDLVVPDSGTTC